MPKVLLTAPRVAFDRNDLDRILADCREGCSIVYRLESGRIRYFAPADVQALKGMNLQLPKTLQSNPQLKEDFFKHPLATGLFIYDAKPPYNLLYLEVDYSCRLNKPDCRGAAVTHIAPTIARKRQEAIEKAISNPDFEQRYTYPYQWNLPGNYSYSPYLQALEPQIHNLRYNCSAIYLEDCGEVLIRIYDNNATQKALFQEIEAMINSARLAA
jgi:hypothetical protein